MKLWEIKMGIEDKIEQYDKKLEKLKAEKERAQGTIDHLTEKLKNDFECDSIEEAEIKMETLQKKADKYKNQIDETLESFEEKYQDVLTD